MTSTHRAMPFGALLRRLELLSRIAVWTGGALTLACVFLISFDVLARKFFGFTVGGSDELSGYVFAISITWAFAYVLLQRGNVRVDVLYQHLPPRLAALLDWVSLVALGVFIGALTWHGSAVALTSWERSAAANTPLATPLWLPQGLWVLGLAWTCIVLVLQLIPASVALVTGDAAAMKDLCGVRSTREEAEEEAETGERLVRGGTQ